jgi:hypothetical protein
LITPHQSSPPPSPPEDNSLGNEAKWALSQKDTNLLEDGDNYRYNLYCTIAAGKLMSYRCQLTRSKKCPAVAYLNTENNKIIKIANSLLFSLRRPYGSAVTSSELSFLC